MISVSSLSKAFGSQTLFANVSFQLNAGGRYGLVGANGSGKSTLLRVLSGEEPPSEGEVSLPKRLRLGVLRQDHFQYETVPILDVALMGNQELWEAMAAKQELLEKADQEFDAERYSQLEEVVLRHDGYSFEARAAEILEGLGIPAEVHRNPLSTLSGGFKLRVLLAQVLAADPDALLLDEPTNHLDILSIRWLEKFLVEFSGCVVVISHDHRFLDNVCTHILDVDYETVTLYPGNYARFEVAKVEQRRLKESEIAKREREIAHHQQFVERFRAKATKARQAKSKQKLIDRVELEPLPVSSRRYPRFRFPQRRPSGKQALRVKHLSKAFADNHVLEDVSFSVHRGDRLAIMGPNGIGKSTLLKILVGRLEADAGSVEWGYETHPGYFAQDHHDSFDNDKQTVESWLWEACPGESIGFVRNRLAQVLFQKDEVDKRLGNLSGGEAARLVFARLAVESPNVLLLDEPTNHLDLEAIEALIDGLERYEGTLLLVSHDRWFVSQLATRILEITPGGIRDYAGTYEEYVHYCGDDHLDADVALSRARREKKADKKERRQQRPDGRVRQLEKRRDEVTAEMERVEDRVQEINDIFCDPKYFQQAPREDIEQLDREQKLLSEQISALTEEWESLEQELEALEAR